MQLYVWRGEKTNFGDELNNWLIPKIFPGLFDDDNSTIFLAIGSVIFDFHPPGSRKIVFGAGYGGYTPLPKFDETWRFYCVRGPRTAAACGLSADMVAGDTAILVNQYRAGSKQPAGVAFMPHYDSVERGNWQAACELAGVRYIDPRAPVEDVLDAIQGCEVLIAEAMHGAIVADALRVPWIPVLPVHASHRMKWRDWAEALDLELKPYASRPSSLAEALVTLRGGKGDGRGLAKAGGLLRAGVKTLDWGFVRLAAARLSQLAKMDPTQSSDRALARSVERLEARADEIRRDLC
jgi:Polysaccharide pyruvyl transferase